MRMGSRVLICFIFVLVLIGCTKDWNPMRHTIIDWVDFVKLEGGTYQALYGVVLSDPGLVTGEVAGKVKFHVDENVTNPSYETKEGDAAFLEEGTKLYVIQGLDPTSYLAVKDDTKVGGYKLYGNEDLVDLRRFSYDKLVASQVSQIEIYEGYDGTKRIKGIEGEEVLELMELLSSGVKNEEYRPSVSEGDPAAVRLVFDDGDPILQEHLVMKDDVHYYWHADGLTLLDDEVGRYVQP